MNQIFLVKSNGTAPVCPHCGGSLKHRDKRMRIKKKEGGIKQWLIINRLQCTRCHCCHSELPDCILPHKHYETEIISGVIDGIVTADDQDSEDYPCFMTMLRWLAWFNTNLINIDGLLRKAISQLVDDCDALLTSNVSLLESIRKTSKQWLETVIRTIYNSGGFLPPFY